MEKFKRLYIYLYSLLLVVIDQIIKIVVIKNIQYNPITIIKGILKFSYCENKGVAFSIGDGHVPMFIILNIFIIIGMVLFYEKNREEFKGICKIFFTMVIAGGVSNLLDRIFRGYVIDFIDINDLFSFAIFNVADIFIVCGIIGLVIYMLFKEIKERK